MSQATCNAVTQAASNLREFDMKIEYYGGIVTRRIQIVQPDISAAELIKMIRGDGAGSEIGDTFVPAGEIHGDDGLVARFWTTKHQRSAYGEVFEFCDPRTGKDLG